MWKREVKNWVKVEKVAEREKLAGLVRRVVNREKVEIMHNNPYGKNRCIPLFPFVVRQLNKSNVLGKFINRFFT